MADLKAYLDGPTAIAFVRGDAALAAKALTDFARTTGTLTFKGGLLNGRPLTVEQITDIARLPSRDVLIGRLVGLVASPLTGPGDEPHASWEGWPASSRRSRSRDSTAGTCRRPRRPPRTPTRSRRRPRRAAARR
jgi:large subunit ribosomal protein L10